MPRRILAVLVLLTWVMPIDVRARQAAKEAPKPAKDTAKAAPARPANRLARETSPYLLQHAHNPVDWYPWGPEAFERARKEDRPIFLSIGYSSCYWCHVMERECFENAEIARTLNERFVCVKVDREERPDVDSVYMTALQAFTGGGGGWPMSLFLTPDGRPFFGGTYFPPEDRDGLPGFPRVVKGVTDAWTQQRKQVETAADSLAGLVKRTTEASAARIAVPLDLKMLAAGQAALAEEFDREHGGFGYDAQNSKQPKFPEAANLTFLLDRYRRTRAGNPVARNLDPEAAKAGDAALEMATITLDNLARGGIRDHLGGGYHRYSTERTWTVPHFEKMLYDNALLASVFVDALEQTGDERWKREAVDIFRFVARDLTDPAGGFYSALDAETEGQEGAFYVWNPTQIENVLGPGECSAQVATVYGLGGRPNFEGERFVLRLQPARDPKTAGAADPRRDPEFAHALDRLLEARNERPRPRRDDKVLTAWNGLMIAALADGYRVLKDPAYRDAANRAADFVWKNLRTDEGRLLRTWRAGQAKLPAYLEDHAFLAWGLIRLHAATGDAARLEQARAVADRMIADFEDTKRGGFYSTANDHETLLARPKEPFDNALPSGNSLAIRALLAIARASGEAKYREAAGRALDAFSFTIDQRPLGVPMMLVGLAEFLQAGPDLPAPGLVPTTAQAPADSKDPLGVGRAKVVTAQAAVAPRARPPVPGGLVTVHVTVAIDKGWHIYANPAGSESARPTVVGPDPKSPVRVLGVDYPAGTVLPQAESDDPVLIYEGSVTIPVRLQLDEKTPAGPLEVPLFVRYQPCNDRACLAPTSARVVVALDVQAR